MSVDATVSCEDERIDAMEVICRGGQDNSNKRGKLVIYEHSVRDQERSVIITVISLKTEAKL